MSLSAEAQHVIDSLEAHLNALKAAVKDASAEAVEHVERAWEDARSWLDEFRAKLEGSIGESAPTNGASTTADSAQATAGVVTGTAAAPPGSAPEQGSGGQEAASNPDPSGPHGSADRGGEPA